MACTQQQCEELEILMEALALEVAAISLELGALQSELTAAEGALELAHMCWWDCECNLQAPAAAGDEKKTTTLTPEQKAQVRMMARLYAMARKNPPTASDPKQV